MNWEMKKVMELVKGKVVCTMDGSDWTAFASGQEALEKLEGKYVITSISAEDSSVVLTLETDTSVPNDMNADWIKSHIEKYGKEPNPFDGM